MSNQQNIEKLEAALGRIKTKESKAYFLVYDTKGNARASIKYIYDLALTLNQNGITSKILVEDSTYVGVESWLGDKYKELEVVSIKEDKVEINIDDAVVVPEYYTNTLQKLSNIKCIKVLLIQQREYIYENLPIGSRFSD